MELKVDTFKRITWWYIHVSITTFLTSLGYLYQVEVHTVKAVSLNFSFHYKLTINTQFMNEWKCAVSTMHAHRFQQEMITCPHISFKTNIGPQTLTHKQMAKLSMRSEPEWPGIDYWVCPLLLAWHYKPKMCLISSLHHTCGTCIC